MSGERPIIEVHNLVRRFRRVRAVDGLSFSVMPGQVVGFVGANGAGKTTTMRIMATLDVPTSGTVRICGHDVMNFPTRVRHAIGWMPDAYGAYDYVSVFEYLDFYARAFGFKGKERRERVDEVMEFVDLHPLAQRDMNELSKGMRQRLCLGRTLLNDPAVLILDEPAAGLDPKARVEFIRLVRLLAEDGKTVFISSHILSELGQMCDAMLFIDDGKLVHQGSAESLMKESRAEALVSIKVHGDDSGLREWAMMRPGVTLQDESVQGIRILVDDSSPDDMSRHLKSLIDAGIQVVEFHQEKLSLEDAFVSMLDRSNGVEPPALPGGNGT